MPHATTALGWLRHHLEHDPQTNPQEKLYSLEGKCWVPGKHAMACMKGRHVWLPALAEPGRGQGVPGTW